MRRRAAAPPGRPAAVLARAALLALAALAAPAQADDLLDILALALESDPQFQAAGAANRAAQEGRPQARAQLLPSVGFDAGVNANETDIRASSSAPARAGTSAGFPSHSLELTVTQPLYRHELWIALDQSESRIRQADALYAATRQDLMVRVADAYFGVLRAIDELAFARAEQEAFGQQLRQSEQRFEVGLIAITDVEEAKAGHDLARSRVIQAENAVDVAHEALREVTGRYHVELAPLAGDVPLVTPEPADIEAWTATALAQNFNLAAAMAASETARDEIKRAYAGHLPTVDLVGSHGRNRQGGGVSGSSRTWTTSIGLRLNVPIYEGGETVSQTRESRHLYQQSLDELERARRATHRETRDAYLGVETGISQVRALEQAVRSNEAAVEAIEAGFQVGTRTSVDVLNAQRDRFEARRDLANSRYDYVIDVLRLKRAAGTLSEDDLAQVNAWLR